MGNSSTKRNNSYSPNTLSQEMLQLLNNRNSFSPIVDSLSLGSITLQDIQRSLNSEEIQAKIKIDTEMSRDEIVNYINELNSINFEVNNVDGLDEMINQLNEMNISPVQDSVNNLEDIEDILDEIQVSEPAPVTVNNDDLEDILDEIQVPEPEPVAITDDMLDFAINDLFSKINVETVKFKEFKNRLSVEYFNGADMKPFSSYIKEKVTDLVDNYYRSLEKQENEVIEDEMNDLMETLESVTISKPVIMKQPKECPPDKILNPKTGRCVLRTGKIGKQIIKNMALN